MTKLNDGGQDNIYDPAFVANSFNPCSSNYRRWSVVSSFGLIYLWRHQCVARLPLPAKPDAIVIDLMAGTGEIWPHLLSRFSGLPTNLALDISHRMHLEAVERLHDQHAGKIAHLETDVLRVDLPTDHADLVVSIFGLKTFHTDQKPVLAVQVARALKPGGVFL